MEVQRRLEFSLAPGLEWSVLCYLDLETPKDNGGREPAPTIVDFKEPLLGRRRKNEPVAPARAGE